MLICQRKTLVSKKLMARYIPQNAGLSISCQSKTFLDLCLGLLVLLCTVGGLAGIRTAFVGSLGRHALRMYAYLRKLMYSEGAFSVTGISRATDLSLAKILRLQGSSRKAVAWRFKGIWRPTRAL